MMVRVFSKKMLRFFGSSINSHALPSKGSERAINKSRSVLFVEENRWNLKIMPKWQFWDNCEYLQKTSGNNSKIWHLQGMLLYLYSTFLR